jgi:hypothetical protein
MTPTLHKTFSTGHAGKPLLVTFYGRFSMLNTGCWITNSAHMVKFQNIEYRETSIEHQPELAKVLDETIHH